MISAPCYLRVVSLSLTPLNLACGSVLLGLISIARFVSFFKSLVFAFKGQNMTFAANVLLTRILYCNAGPGYD